MADHELFIDVRTKEEWGEGHLDGAMHFDLARLERGEVPDIPKDAPIAVYCRAGYRAQTALGILRKKGFENVRNAGGFDGIKIIPMT